jgi:hypothetical protein
MSNCRGWELPKSWKKKDEKFFKKLCKANLTLCPNYYTLHLAGYERACIWKGQKNEPDAENVVVDGDLHWQSQPRRGYDNNSRG